ncbi:hypothetical protein EVA_17724 [gut metagenome]|uniref:Uncharacterized protein n=1 Tax=gut metagenome TaxID=749906 RepID=J9FGY7_9ZZZZ
MSESTCTALGFIEHFNRSPFHYFMTGYNHLGDAFAILHHKVFLREVDEDNPDFTTIVGVDRSGGIEHANTFLEGQTGTGTDLGLIACGQGDGEAGGHQSALEGVKYDGLVQMGAQIHSGTQCGRISRQGMAGAIDNLYFHDLFSYV